MFYLNLPLKVVFISWYALWIEWIICHPLQIPWDYRYIKGTKSNGWHIDLVAKKTGILVEKLSKAAKNQPQSANCKTSVQKLSKYVKSWLPCPVHVQCIFSHLSIVYFGWKLNQEDKFLSQWATLSVLVLTNLSFFSNSYLRILSVELARLSWLEIKAFRQIHLQSHSEITQWISDKSDLSMARNAIFQI